MLKYLLAAIFTVAAFAALLWIVGSREPVYKVTRGTPAFFAAIKFAGEPLVPKLADGVIETWAASPRFTLIGEQPAYWDGFMVVTGGTSGEMPLTLGPGIADAYVAEIGLLEPPRLLLGLLRLLHVTGLRTIPDGETIADSEGMGVRSDMLPSAANMERLMAQPADFNPVMMNFLAYYETARYAEPREGASPSTGAEAYGRYGQVALQTVYRAGGRFHFAGTVKQVLRDATGWEQHTDWNTVAVMEYPEPEAILTMERVPEYRASLFHRDAGLDATVVIASEQVR